MPLDYEPHADGNVTVTQGAHGLVGTTHGPLQLMMMDAGERFMPHHATCPDAGQWRR